MSAAGNGDRENSLEVLLDFGPDGQNLVPVVSQDSGSREVLILAYVNREAFEESLRTSYACFYSRSRKTLWRKGETSGNRLRIVEMRVNCEQNSLLWLVEQEGPGACHVVAEDGLAYHGCFYRRLEGGRLAIKTDGAYAPRRAVRPGS